MKERCPLLSLASPMSLQDIQEQRVTPGRDEATEHGEDVLLVSKVLTHIHGMRKLALQAALQRWLAAEVCSVSRG